MSSEGWYGRRFFIRRQQLEDARQRLGIRIPVELKLTVYTNREGTVARLVGLRGGKWRIALDTHLRANQASMTVYHELAHVLQAERLGGMEQLVAQRKEEEQAAGLIGPNQRKHLRGRAVDRMPLEVEAEQRARRWHKQRPLAEPRKR